MGTNVATTSRLALACALLPFVSVHACYLLAAYQGHVDWCIPYIDGCTSISKTGRNGAAYLLFKATMIPAAVLMMLYWTAAARRLSELESTPTRAVALLPALGLVCGLFLIAYTVALGHHGDEFRLVRRVGVILHFASVYFCELLLTARLAKLSRRDPRALAPWIPRLMWACCFAALAIGVLHDIAEAIDPRYDEWEDAVEWNFALMINVHYLLQALAWKRLAASAPA